MAAKEQYWDIIEIFLASRHSEILDVEPKGNKIKKQIN